MVSFNEIDRLNFLTELEILDTEDEKKFDQLTQLAASFYQVPIALISLVDSHRQWFKSKVGLNICQTDRDIAFCSHALSESDVMLVPDARLDSRFNENPLVTGSPNIVFYAGAVLRPDGVNPIGTLCIIDHSPRAFTLNEMKNLRLLANQVEELIRLHQKQQQLDVAQTEALHLGARLQGVVNGAAAGMLRINAQGSILGINDYALNLLGYRREELLAQNVKCLMPDDLAKHHDSYLANFLETGVGNIIGQGRRVFALHKQGHSIPVHLAISCLDYEKDGKEFVGILSDLSELNEIENQVKQERAFLRSIIDGASNPIFAKNLKGEYLIANKASLDFVGLNEEMLSGTRARNLFSETLVKETESLEQTVIESGQSGSVLLNPSEGVFFNLTKSPIKDVDGRVIGTVNVAHDVSRLHAALDQISKQERLLNILHQGLTDYKSLIEGESLWEFLEKALLELTESEYALIGEVQKLDDDTSCLKILSITDLSWDGASRQLMKRLRSGDMRLSNPDSLLGKTFASGEIVKVKNALESKEGTGFPAGHPAINHYLGVPIFSGNELLGMYSIANAKNAYDDELIEWLKPFTSTCALLISLYRQLAERELFTEELKQAYAEADRASRAKSEFVSSMSHELRTPLNAILGFSNILLNNKTKNLNDRQQQQLSQIHKSGEHLLNLINEILDLSAIEAGKLAISIEDVVLVELVEEVLETLQPIANQYRVKLNITYDLEHRLLQVKADYTRLKQVFLNLITNAIKYNKPDGQVDVRMHIAIEKVTVQVSDTGIGISTNQLFQLFKPFNRAGAENSNIEGTGVGLALTRRILEYMGSSIQVESEVGKGSVFSFELPITSNHHSIQPQELNSYEKVKNIHNRQFSLLSVEDNPINQALINEFLEDYNNISIHAVSNAEVALEIACDLLPDLILMDLDLEGMNGINACRLIRQNPLIQDIPVVAISARSDLSRSDLALFNAVITKPLSYQNLGKVLHVLLFKEAGDD